MTCHPLRTYRQKTDISLAKLAEKVGTTRASLSRIECGRQTPSLDLVSRIIKATGGKLKADDFLPRRSAA